MIRHILLTYFLFLAFVFSGNAQHLTLLGQYMFNGLVLNPAYAGSRDVASLTSMYRAQWVGFEGAPTTQMISGHGLLKEKNIGLGGTIMNDQFGLTNQVGAYASFSYIIDFRDKKRFNRNTNLRRFRKSQIITKEKLAFGLQVGGGYLRNNWSRLILENPDDIAFVDDPTYKINPNIGAGIYYYTNLYYFGVSVPDLVNRNGQLLTDRRGFANFLVTGGGVMDLSEEVKLQPSFLLRYIGNSPMQLDLNSNLVFLDRFWVGASYRINDSVLGLLQFQVNDQFKVGYSYEAGISDFAQRHNGTHEILLMYEFKFKAKFAQPSNFF